MNDTNIREQKPMNDASISVKSWLGYGTEFITIFAALLVLAGRVYVQSYWNVFGLTPEITNNSLLDYAIVSPNVAILSVFITASTVLIISIFRNKIPDIIGDKNPKISFYIGIIIVWVGLSIISLITKLPLSKMTPGLAGLLFGLGYLGFIFGPWLWFQAGIKLENNAAPTWKWQIVFTNWVQNIPRIILLGAIIIVFSTTSLWALVDTAEKFGANEAKFAYDNRPIVGIQLDSPKGFEGLPSLITNNRTTILGAKIITENSDFLFVDAIYSANRTSLHVMAVPISRIQSIHYTMDVTPLGN
jgi:hypothetical protein